MTLDVIRPSCPNCHGGAVISSRMRNAPEVTVWTCSECSHQWSGIWCDSRVCRSKAVVRCGQCSKVRCANHGFHGRTASKQGICDACVRRTADAIKASRRETSWSRTGGLYR